MSSAADYSKYQSPRRKTSVKLFQPTAKRHFVSGAAAICAFVLTVGSVSSCSQIQTTPGAAGSSTPGGVDSTSTTAGNNCVDASGDNSTVEEITEAALDAPYRDDVTGQTRAVWEELGRLTDDPKKGQLTSRQERLEFAFKYPVVFSDVPPGGDAAFAAAVCALPGWSPGFINGSFMLLSAGIGTPAVTNAGNTPHVLRGFGRSICFEQISEMSKADEALDRLAAQAEQDPDGYRHVLIDMSSPKDAWQTDQETKALIDFFKSSSPSELVERAQIDVQMRKLAVKYQCPQKQH